MLFRSHDIGFQINCSYGNGYRLTGDESYRAMQEKAAAKLAKRFLPVVGCTKSWDWKHAPEAYPVIIDNMMNLELLMWSGREFGVDSLTTIACTHANTTMLNHFRDDYTSYHGVMYDRNTGEVLKKRTFQGYADESAWARGQGWAIYGYTMMYDQTCKNGNPCEEYLSQAENIAKMLLERLPEDGIPYWDFDAPEIPNEYRDASAGSLMASAFVQLSTLTKDKSFAKACLAMAEKQIRTLASEEYLAAPGTNGDFLLKHSVNNMPKNMEVDTPQTYADYYFLEALLRYKAL